MLSFLLAAGLTLTPVELPEPVLDVRVVDIDADGHEDVVAVSERHLYLFPTRRGPGTKHPAPPLVVVGRGLLGVVEEGRFRRIEDPFGAFQAADVGPASLLAALGKTKPVLLDAPGDLDGDGRDDPVLCGPEGFVTPAGLVPVVPEAQLDLYRNEAFAVEYRIPVPVAGNWTGKGRELAFFHEGAVVAFRGTREVERVPLPLTETGAEAAAMRRNEVLLQDVDGDGRLDLAVVIATGKTELFAKFEATVRLFRGGQVYDQDKRLFHRPVSFVKVAGLLLKTELVDLDRDGDLDLALSTVDTSVLSTAAGVATGTAPGTYHLFRFDGKADERTPAWPLSDPVPLSALTDKPQPPVRFLPDYDGDGRPEALAVDGAVRILVANADGGFDAGPSREVEGAGRPSVGRTFAAVPHKGGLLIVEAAR